MCDGRKCKGFKECESEVFCSAGTRRGTDVFHADRVANDTWGCRALFKRMLIY